MYGNLALYLMGEYYMRVGCQYERVRYSGWYNFVWNDSSFVPLAVVSRIISIGVGVVRGW